MVDPLEKIHPRSLAALAHHVQKLLAARLWAQIVLGMVLGVAVGLALSPDAGYLEADTANTVGEWLALPGQLFLTMIQMIVVPLVLASVIRGIAASGNVEQLRHTGLGLGAYFLLTTIMATGIGIGISYLFAPGTMMDPVVVASLGGGVDEVEGVAQVASVRLEDVPAAMVSLLPDNPLNAMVQAEMLQIVVFSVVIGLALVTLEPTSSKPMFELMGSLQSVCMAVVSWVMRLAPLAVFGLLARVMIQTGSGVLVGMGAYAATVVGGLLVLLVFYLGIAGALARQRPLRFLVAIREAQLLAFSTGSSAATMPVSIRAAEEKLGVRPTTAQLVIPIGATMNMGGTALYHGLATVFMAQMFDMELTPSALLALVLTSLGASIGAPATPGVGIMILATVLTSAGVPISGLALIIGLDRILEPLRCVLNVTGDLVACVVMDRFAHTDRSAAEERADEARREVTRERTGADLVTEI